MSLSDANAPDHSTEPSERRLAANRANAQLSTGPRTPEGKAKSSLNAVKTGLTGRTILLADEEEAQEYCEHIERVRAWWQPKGDREHTLVQSLADTQWRLNAIPGLESALYALARQRGEALLTHENPAIQRLLLDAQAEVAEAKALKNLRLHEGRLRRQYEKDEAELKQWRQQRFLLEAKRAREDEERRQEEEEQQRREEGARKRAERKKAREAAALPESKEGWEPAPHLNGFEFSPLPNTDTNSPYRSQ